MAIEFELLRTDAGSEARLGRLRTARGEAETPAFMPVGTQATVKGVTPEQVQATGARILLANAYHLHLKPGEDIVAALGGLHRFMHWPHAIITDSGGYQVFSLPKHEVNEEGVRFRWESQGEAVMLTPERAMAIQQKLGADIMMAFDECVPFPCPYPQAKEAMERTLRWAARCKEAWSNREQALFAIVQGGTYEDLRRASAQGTAALELPGIAIGGLSVGEGLETMREVLGHTMPHLPANRPRYLMGVGLPEDILAAVEAGVDMMDCVIPTKYARNGTLFTQVGRLRVTNREYRRDKFPPDTNCRCYTCAHYSRAYLHHLFDADEIFGQTLATIHNLSYYGTLMADIRQAIREDRFIAFKRAFLDKYSREGKRRRRVG
jgi:queuine tRNA-ribosyltransferase